MRATQWEAKLVLPVSADRDHVQGSPDAPVTLVEYGDYECPYCGEAYPIVKEIQERMDGGLRFVFRNFPISTSHPHAEQAAEAAEAAAAQGRFWEMQTICTSINAICRTITSAPTRRRSSSTSTCSTRSSASTSTPIVSTRTS